jgi:hypothetical protein
MGPRGDVTVDVLCQLARGHTAARDGFKPRFPAGGFDLDVFVTKFSGHGREIAQSMHLGDWGAA